MFDLQQANLSNDGVVVLQGLKLRILAGEKVAVLGKSGAGKSTLLRYLYAQKRELSAWIPQHPALVEVLSVYHNVYMGRLDRYPLWRNLWNLLRPVETDVNAIRALLTELKLEHKLFARANTLSGGQQQRTSVARALYQNKKLILADEPVSAVDVKQGLEILRRINSHTDTVIIALHDAELALNCMQRIIGIRDGGIMMDAPASELTMDDIHALYT